MKYFLFLIILVGCFGFVFSLLTSAIGVSMVILVPLTAAIIIWVKNYQKISRKKIQLNILLFSALTIFFYGCTVKVPMTPDVRHIEYKEKLTIDAGLLITENARQYVFRGNPESFTGGGRPHEFPLGETLELASKLIFSELFNDVTLIRSLKEGRRFKLIIEPQIDDFHFRYDQLSHAGFAVSCYSRMMVTITLFSENAKIWEKTIESPEVGRGPWMLNVEYERDLGESASEAMVSALNQLALEIAKDTSLRAHILGQTPLSALQPQKKQELTSTPEPAPAAKVIYQPQEKPKMAAIFKDEPITRVGLRRVPRMITNDSEITSMLVEYNFFDLSKNPHGSFRNDFVDNNDGTVTDRATGLMWEKNGSSFLTNKRAKKYIEQLNSQRFAGYSDWRIPTVEELASLLSRKRNSGVHLNPVFDRKQSRCWTADKGESKSWSWYKGAWLVDFKNGGVNEAYWTGEASGQYRKNAENYVKAVRSIK